LGASGGTAPETVADARLRAPFAFRQRRLRAITPEDYARLVEDLFPGQVQRAFADEIHPSTSRPGRFDVKVWFDALAGAEVTARADPGSPLPLPAYRSRRRHGSGWRTRSAGGDVKVTVEARAVGERVKAAIEAALGRRGFFCPDRLTFETGISLSEMVATVQGIPGIAFVRELVVSKSTGGEEKWPDMAAGSDLVTFAPGQIPTLGELTVE